MSNILYVASSIDIATGKRLGSTKIGIATNQADRRIQSLNSTKMPNSVELEGAWGFENSAIDAAKAERALHALLAHDHVNGEWFRDEAEDLVDRVSKCLRILGATPVGDANEEFREMNSRTQKKQKLMRAFFDPHKERLEALSVDWEYLEHYVGVTTTLGRILVSVRKSETLSFRLTQSVLSVEELQEETALPWSQGSRDNLYGCSGVSKEAFFELMETHGKTTKLEDAIDAV